MPDDRPTADGIVEKRPDGSILSGGQVDIAHPDPIFEPIHRAYTEKYGTPDD